MSSRELGPEWVLSSSLADAEASGHDNSNYSAVVARRLWTLLQAHGPKQQ